MARWISQIVQPPTMNATFKARDDITRIAASLGYHTFSVGRFSDPEADDKQGKPLRTRIDGITGAITTGDFVVYQYPSYNGMAFERQLLSTIYDRQVTLILFVHDSELLRGTGNQDELDRFNLASGLIVHTQAMKQRLIKAGVTKPMYVAEAFDYLADSPRHMFAHQDQYPFERKLVYAGGLEKAGFLNRWNLDTPLTVFGQGAAAMSSTSGVTYGGGFMPDELLWHLPFRFGLAWDTDTKDGAKYGDYTRYNAPQKVSLYLSMGLPVIIWSGAGMAPFIKANHLGYTVDELEDIDQLMADLSDADVKQTLTNVDKLHNAFHEGFFTRRALQAAENATRYPLVYR